MIRETLEAIAAWDDELLDAEAPRSRPMPADLRLEMEAAGRDAEALEAVVRRLMYGWNPGHEAVGEDVFCRWFRGDDENEPMTDAEDAVLEPLRPFHLEGDRS